MKPTPAKSRPHVALMVDTSLASGQNILRGVGHYVRGHGRWSLFNSPQGFDQRVIARLRERPDSGIIARIDTPEFARLLQGTKLPVVDVLGLIPDTGFPVVHVDDEAIARAAFGHLSERGFRQFAFVGFKGTPETRGGRNWSERRRYVFTAQARGAGSEAAFLEFSAREMDEEPWEEREERLAEWLRKLPKPLGVFACNDHCGFDVLEACRRADLHVPDEVSVLGVDNEEQFCEICTPPLSSMSAGHAGVGYQAAALLDRLMRGERPPSEPIRVAPGSVIARQSSDAFAVKDGAVARALRLIRERSCSGISIDEITRASGTSRSVLQRRFRAVLGRSIHDTIVHTRMGHAMDLLIATDMPLSEIAELSGFNHQEYMGVVFRDRMGRTPAQIRRDAQSAPSGSPL